MSAQSSPCFYRSVSDYENGRISFEKHIRNALSHVFARTRHLPYDEEVDNGDVVYWIDRDALSAAVLVCMLQRDFNPPLGENSAAEEILVKMLLYIKVATLAELRRINESASVLAIPLFYQLLVCVALEHGNRNLVREMILDAPPGPKFQLLFSPPEDPSSPQFRKFHETVVLDGQTDSGCELYCALIKANWAEPRGYMQRWAALSSDIEGGIQLIDILIESGVEIDERALSSAVWGELAMLEYLLPIYTPEEAITRHSLLKSAAGRKPRGERYLEALFKRGVTDINWMPPPPASPPSPRDAQEMPSPPETPLHVASMAGDPAIVEWLIRHGAKRLKNYYGQDQVQTAKAWKREDNLLVFQRYSGWELKKEKKSSRCIVI